MDFRPHHTIYRNFDAKQKALYYFRVCKVPGGLVNDTITTNNVGRNPMGYGKLSSQGGAGLLVGHNVVSVNSIFTKSC